MVVHKISLQNFRNFEQLDIALDKGINIFYGDNAQGKTNFLESIYFCATGRSQRAKSDRELIQFSKDEAHVRLFTRNDAAPFKQNETVAEDMYENKIDIHIKKDHLKGVAVNGVAIKKLGQLFGVLLAVVFSPEDLQLVKAGPSERRKFMDMELCQISGVYYHDLRQYYHVLKQRNNLLKNIKNNTMSKDTLSVWNEQLVTHGIKIMDHRQEFINKINMASDKIHRKITNSIEKLQILYRPNIDKNDFMDKLLRNTERDVLLGATNVGVHKDDLTFLINDMDVRVYGSQGQQRTASLSAKLAEIDIIREQKQNTPVLLLDDVLSELDESRQTFLMKSISGMQSIITCTGVDDVISKVSAQYSVYKVENGKIYRK